MNVAMLLSCGSFEGFFGKVQGQSRSSYLEGYRNDWSWYYGRGLLANGVRPILYIPALFESGIYETDVGIGVRFLQLARWYRPVEQLSLKRLSRRMRWSMYADDVLNTIAFMDPLKAALREDAIDVLYVQEHWSGRFDQILREVELPVVGADHGGVSSGIVKTFKRRALQKAALCYGQTKRECQTIEAFGGRSKFLPNGCDLSEFSPDVGAPRSKTVVTVTRLTNRQKRTSDLIRAMAELPSEWTLDIVGTGPDKSMLERLAAELELSSRVRFHGFVGRGQVRDMLRHCGVYAMPSAHEAVALAALEAMACGAAVVLSEIAAFKELVEDRVNGCLVPVGDVKGLAGTILQAWENRVSLGSAAADTMRARYDSGRLHAQLAQSLREAAGDRALVAAAS
jgi:glycosyltransferase involved in cell wall biosynthesis